MTKLVFWVEVSFFGRAMMQEPSGAYFNVVEDCVCAVMSSRIDERNASAVFFAWRKARRRYPFVSPALMSLMACGGRRSGDWIAGPLATMGSKPHLLWCVTIYVGF